MIELTGIIVMGLICIEFVLLGIGFVNDGKLDESYVCFIIVILAGILGYSMR